MHLWTRAECEAGEGGHEEVCRGGGQRQEICPVLVDELHLTKCYKNILKEGPALHQLVRVCLRQQLRVVVCEVVGEEEEVLAERRLLICGVELLAQQLYVVLCRPDEVDGVDVRLHLTKVLQ